jgi:antitoxin component YwqK of YwqJK toxin-antitoxin module
MGIFDFFKKKQKEVIKKETTDKFIEEVIQKLKTELDESTKSGAAGAYSTPNAFSDGGSKDKKLKKKIAKTKKVFYDNGSIKEEFQVNEDGVNHGSNKLYYPNQQLKVGVNWTNGIQDDGEVISYHDNGEKARQVILLNNKFAGNFFEWYSNGKNKKQGYYIDEKQIILKEWNENGELIEKDGNLNTKGSSNESDNQEALVDFMLEFSKLKNSLEKSPNLNKIFDEFTYAIRNGLTVREYLEESDSFSAFETINILILGFTKIKDSINKMLEKYEHIEFRADFNALNEAIDILKKESKNNNNFFDQELEKINSQFELVLKSKNNEDYPPSFWYDIVKQRVIYMEQDTNEKILSEVQSEWLWIRHHIYVYKSEYSSYSKNDIIDAMSLRIKRFGFIYKTMLSFEDKLNALAKENNISSYSYLNQFKLEMSSAYASLFGTINYALSIGMTNNDISKLYSDFVYDQDVINVADPFVELETNYEDVTIPKWFKERVFDQGETVESPFTDDEYELNNIELSVYDFILGLEYKFEMAPISVTNKDIDDLQKSLKWFRKTNPEAYKNLLV